MKNSDDVKIVLDKPVLDRGLLWAQEMQRTLHAAGYPTHLRSDENGCELLVPFRGILYQAVTTALSEVAARHHGAIVVDFQQGGVRFMPRRAPVEGSAVDA